jgi:uncharacterized protein (TIGR02246 family)
MQAIAPEDMQTIFDRYAAAWAARDPKRIAALHTPDTTFWLRLGRPPVTGRDQVRAAFAELLVQWPEFALETYRVHIGPDHWVLDWALTSVLTDPDGTRRPVRFDCADIVVVDASGLVERKDTFVDFVQIQEALTPSGAA